VAALLSAGPMAGIAQAHCVPASTNNTITRDNDRFKNFDYTSTGDGDCNVDWPMDFLFYDNAAKGKVTNSMGQIGYNSEGGAMHGKLDDSVGWDWNADKGRKKVENPGDYCFGDVEHFRLYAVYTDNRMYNVDWGYYVPGTSHIDNSEVPIVCPGGYSGDSEKAEERISGQIRNAGSIGLGCVHADAASFDNYMPYATADDGHVKHNSGRATKVCAR